MRPRGADLFQKVLGEPLKAAKTGRFWAVGDSGSGSKKKAPFGLAVCLRIECLRKNNPYGQTGIGCVGSRVVCDYVPEVREQGG